MELQHLKENEISHFSFDRYQHSLGVEDVSYDLALIYGYDTMKASVAGILHDCARHLSDEELISECGKYSLPISKYEEQKPQLLHAKVGAYYAKDKYGVDDSEILNAIKYHTTGRPAMTLLEKIIYIADYIEPNRKPLPRIEDIRIAAYEDLDVAVYMITENILNYLNGRDAVIDKMTQDTYDYYKTVFQSIKE